VTLNVLVGFDPAMMNLLKLVADKLSTNQTQLDRIEAALAAMQQQEKIIMAGVTDFKTAMQDLTNQVQANTDAEASATLAIQKLADLIKANAGDPAAVEALATQLKNSADALSAAIVANTPAGA
jgi:chromosome segregation ATPase